MNQLEARLARIESHLGLDDAATATPEGAPLERLIIPGAGFDGNGDGPAGQNAFALAGVIALTVGTAFMLSQSYPNLPSAMPGGVAVAVAAVVWWVARLKERRLGSAAGYLRGAAMLLGYFGAVRFSVTGDPPVLDVRSFPSRAVLVAAVLVNATVAWRARSAWLVFLAFALGCATALVVGTGVSVLAALPLLMTGVVLAARRGGWPLLPAAALPLLYATYFLWAIGNPARGGKVHYVTEPTAAPWIVLLTLQIFALATLFRRERSTEDGPTKAGALVNCGVGYACLLVHSAAAFPASFAALHGAAFAAFLGWGMLFWFRERSRVLTFVHAMTGYFALSMTIVKLAGVPVVFGWLSLQSLLVVSTAIWFRSSLIVVANFAIYVAIVVTYLFVAKSETGLSVGFGLVALATARILEWQQSRLELKTSLMRNAYLVSAFLVLPYALHHLVPGRVVALAWVALAVAYYAVTWRSGNREYRWMGHGTLAFAGIFLVFAGPGRLEPFYRVASFLALGAVLLVVALALKTPQRR